MIAIELAFPTGRWHATPWSRQVNEGAVEWPPSPWRLLRALLAVWHNKCPDIQEDQMRGLIDALTSPPSYHLPQASQGHTRHYMPVANDKKTKVFDTFVTIAPHDSVIVVWPDTDLDDLQRRLLNRLLGMMSYFGRAESWVDARLLGTWKGRPNAVPANGHPDTSDSTERVRLLTAVAEEDYDSWRTETLSNQLDCALKEKQNKAYENGKSPDKVRLSAKEQGNIESNLPATLFEALHANTGVLRKAGWNRPPGSRWIDYLRPIDAFASKPRRSPCPHRRDKPTVARFAICGNVRPRLTEALWVGERIRTSLMSYSCTVQKKESGQDDANAAQVFSGKQDDGSSSHHGHMHAHLLCESSSEEQAGLISHLTVFAPCGFNNNDELALKRVRRIWGHGGHDLQLVLLGLGKPDQFGGSDERIGQSRLLALSDTWVSRTPFVPTDHLRIRPNEARDHERRQKALIRELQRVVRKEFERRTWLSQHRELIQTIEPLIEPAQCGTDLGGNFTTWLKFRRERKRGNGHRGTSHGYGFRLKFSQPVRGPIVLGYGCHFGLGQFVAREDT